MSLKEKKVKKGGEVLAFNGRARAIKLGSCLRFPFPQAR